jgi:hypothetical protein
MITTYDELELMTSEARVEFVQSLTDRELADLVYSFTGQLRPPWVAIVTDLCARITLASGPIPVLLEGERIMSKHYLDQDAAPEPRPRARVRCECANMPADPWCPMCLDTGLRLETDEEYHARLDGEQHARDLFNEARRPPQ